MLKRFRKNASLAAVAEGAIENTRNLRERARSYREFATTAHGNTAANRLRAREAFEAYADYAALAYHVARHAGVFWPEDLSHMKD